MKDLKEYLPVGSVVRLKNGKRDIVIMGIMQLYTEEKNIDLYDYIGVLYPEGFIGGDVNCFFNNDDIEEIVFTGFNDARRERYLDIIQHTFDKMANLMSENNEV